MKRKNLFGAILTTLVMALLPMSATAQEEGDLDAKYATTLLQPGTEAPDFTLSTPNDGPIQLKDLVGGHYAVLDFWASWCPDCRKDIPNVKRMYERFGQKGVVFVGVSFDNDREKWLNYVEKENLDYVQTCELKRMKDSEVASLYGIRWIPSMYLIGPDGRVLLATVMSEKVEQALEAIFPE